MTAGWEAAFAPKCGESGAVLVGLLGRGIAASRTPRMHMAEGAAMGIPYDYRLIDADLAGDDIDLTRVFSRLRDAGYDGINVTFPFKQAVMPLLDGVSDSASAVNAVNTVVFRDGVANGENTDWWGFRESFIRGLPGAKRDRVLLLGAGGAGGAVAQALADEGAQRLLIHDLDPAKAAALSVRLGSGRAEAVGDLAAAAATADGIVNTTPVGMTKLPGMPLPVEMLTPRHWVADIVYFPLETELLRIARAKGCQVLPGSSMAVFQAVRAFQHFTGLAPDEGRMEAAFNAFDEDGPG